MSLSNLRMTHHSLDIRFTLTDKPWIFLDALTLGEFLEAGKCL